MCLEELPFRRSGFDGAKCALCAAEHKQFAPFPCRSFFVLGKPFINTCLPHAKEVRETWASALDPVEEPIAA